MELNQYLSESRKRRRKRRRVIWLVLIVVIALACIGGILWLIFWSPFVRMDRIVVKGNVEVPESEIVGSAQSAFAKAHYGFGLLGARNILAWPAAIVSSVLAQQFQLASATLEKDYGEHTIVLSVTERQPLAIWCAMAKGEPVAPADSSTLGVLTTDRDCYWFDNTGLLFAKAFDTEGDLLLAVHDYSQTGLAPGQPILPARFAPNMLSILGVLQSSGLGLKEIRLNDLALEEVQVATYNGPSIYYSLRFPADDTFAALQSAMAKSNFNELQYVDFRTQGRMYYQ